MGIMKKRERIDEAEVFFVALRKTRIYTSARHQIMNVWCLGNNKKPADWRDQSQKRLSQSRSEPYTHYHAVRRSKIFVEEIYFNFNFIFFDERCFEITSGWGDEE